MGKLTSEGAEFDSGHSLKLNSLFLFRLTGRIRRDETEALSGNTLCIEEVSSYVEYMFVGINDKIRSAQIRIG